MRNLAPFLSNNGIYYKAFILKYKILWFSLATKIWRTSNTQQEGIKMIYIQRNISGKITNGN